MVDLLNAPIPGQSLTDTPKNSPWESPPEMVKVPEIVDFYIGSLADDDKMTSRTAKRSILNWG